jgi:hypothetical protein
VFSVCVCEHARLACVHSIAPAEAGGAGGAAGADALEDEEEDEEAGASSLVGRTPSVLSRLGWASG